MTPFSPTNTQSTPRLFPTIKLPIKFNLNWSKLKLAASIIALGIVGGLLLGVFYGLFFGLMKGLLIGSLHGVLASNVWILISYGKW